MRDTIDMAREAGLFTHKEVQADLKAFEALVRADQDEKYKWDIHSCGPTCKRYACVAMREAVEAEREACAKVCEAVHVGAYDTPEFWREGVAYTCAAAIRARGKP
jgi:hypothetical protein